MGGMRLCGKKHGSGQILASGIEGKGSGWRGGRRAQSRTVGKIYRTIRYVEGRSGRTGGLRLLLGCVCGGSTGSLLQRPGTDGGVHDEVDFVDDFGVNACGILDPPMHECMSRVWGDCCISLLRTDPAADVAQGGGDEAVRVWDCKGRSSDLGHGGGDEVGDDELDVDAVGLQLARQGGRPVLQERLGAGIDTEKRAWHQAGK